MTGIDLLRWSQKGFLVKLHTSATDFLLEGYSTICQKETSATIILAHALDRSQEEGEQLRALRQSSRQWDESRLVPEGRPATNRPSKGRDFWLSLWTTSGTPPYPELLLVVSCLSWHLGDYPLFLWSSDLPGTTPEAELLLRLQMIQTALLDLIHPRRVFSVFGRADLVAGFRASWTSKTGFNEEPDIYYEALLTVCTKETFRPSGGSSPESGKIRLAGLPDLHAVAVLCKEFADTSVHFSLSQEGGIQEARWLIGRQAVWLYETAGRAVSICAVARQSDNVAVVTKVYTTLSWRRQGFAEALVRKVTEEMLLTKKHVALYVGIKNDAQHVYDRIGFVGLCGKDRVSGMEDVLEIGFLSTDKGYW